MKKYPMGTVASESRRRLLAGVAGVGALAALGAGRALARPLGSSARARAGGAPRRHARRAAVVCASGQGSADQEVLPSAEFRDPDPVLPHGDYAERRVLRALAPRRHPRIEGQGLRAHGRRRERRPRSQIHARPAEEGIQAGRDHRGVASARATAAACSSRTLPASSGAWAPWATRYGAACACATCWRKPGSRAMRSRWC